MKVNMGVKIQLDRLDTDMKASLPPHKPLNSRRRSAPATPATGKIKKKKAKKHQVEVDDKMKMNMNMKRWVEGRKKESDT